MTSLVWQYLSEYNKNNTGDDIRNHIRKSIGNEYDVIWHRNVDDLFMIIPKGKLFGRYIFSTETGEIVCHDFPESTSGTIDDKFEDTNYISYPNGTFLRVFTHKNKTMYATNRTIIADSVSSSGAKIPKNLPPATSGVTDFYILYDPENINVIYYGIEPRQWKIATANADGITYLDLKTTDDIKIALSDEECGIYLPDQRKLIHSENYNARYNLVGNSQNMDYVILRNLNKKSALLAAYSHLGKKIAEIEKYLDQSAKRFFNTYKTWYVKKQEVKYAINRIVCTKIHERYLRDKTPINYDIVREVTYNLDPAILAEILEIDLRF